MTEAPSPDDRRVVVLNDARRYVGPALSRLLAARGHDLVVGEIEDSLADELAALGASVEIVAGGRDLTDPEAAGRLVTAAHERFGRIDAAVSFGGVIVTGSFRRSTPEDLAHAVSGCLEAPYHFLKAVVDPMVEQGVGQVLVITSAAGARPTDGAPLYSAARAAANMLVRNVAAEVAGKGVQVNAVGTNFMDFPDFLRATGADDPSVRAAVESMVPMHRLGTMEEFASMCLPFIDGTSRFVTGQFVACAGGWA